MYLYWKICDVISDSGANLLDVMVVSLFLLTSQGDIINAITIVLHNNGAWRLFKDLRHKGSQSGIAIKNKRAEKKEEKKSKNNFYSLAIFQQYSCDLRENPAWQKWRLQAFPECNAAICGLQDDKYDGVDGGIGMNAEALEADFCRQSVQMKRWETWTD